MIPSGSHVASAFIWLTSHTVTLQRGYYDMDRPQLGYAIIVNNVTSEIPGLHGGYDGSSQRLQDSRLQSQTLLQLW